MTRDEMIDVLIEDRITDWVYAQNTDSLEDMLFVGWKSYNDYTDDELKDALEFLGEEQIENYLLESKKRKTEQRKRWDEDEKKTVETNARIL